MKPAHERTIARHGSGLSSPVDNINALLDSFADTVSSNKRVFYATYCLAFLFFFSLFSYSLWRAGLSFIWSVDGAEQQYNFFILESNWLHELLTNIFVNHSFTVPLWTDTVGYGADYILSVSNTLGNPINLISVFATPETAELWLSLTIPITLFLSGITFLCFCDYHHLDRISSLVGCFVYLFGGFSTIAVTQIFMLYPLFVAPLAFMGFDRVLEQESPVQLIAGTALMGMYSVSSAYMLCLILFVYGVAKFVFLPRNERSISRLAGMFCRAVIPIALGLLVSFVLFLPMCSNIVGQSRLNVSRDQSLFYEASYYLDLVRGFISYSDVGADCKYGFAPVAVLCLLISLTDKCASTRIVKFMIVVSIVVLCLPFLGRVTNGFAYPNNRWIWSLCFFVGVITAISLPKIWEGGFNRRLLVGCSAVALLSVLMIPLSKSTSGMFFAAVCILVGTAILFYCCRGRRSSVVLTSFLSLALSTAMIFYVNGALFVATTKQNIPIGKTYSSVVESSGLSMVQDESDATAFRTDTLGVPFYRNSNLAAGVLGDSFYNSYYNNYVDEYHTSLGLVSSTMNFSYAGFDARTAMEALSGTKYFIVSEQQNAHVPPLFNRIIKQQGNGAESQYLCESDYCLPLAYFADGVVSRSSYDNLNFVDRQNTLLNNVVLEDEDLYSIKAGESPSANDEVGITEELAYSASTSFDGNEDVPSQAQDGDGALQIYDGKIVTTSSNAVVYLNVDIPANSEAYVEIDGLHYTDSSGEAGEPAFIDVYGDGTHMQIWNAGYREHLYGGKDSWCVNTGYSNEDRHVVALQFRDAGTYEFSDLKVVSENVDWIPGKIDELSTNGVSNSVLQGNSFSCTADSDEDGLVYIRIPYSEGWHAQVNGEDVEIKRANIGFMAIEVGSGVNNIVLTYASPYVVNGARFSLLGIALSIVYCIVMKKYNNRGKKTERLPR